VCVFKTLQESGDNHTRCGVCFGGCSERGGWPFRPPCRVSCCADPHRIRGAPPALRQQALELEQLEALAEALLDFGGPEDLATWLGANS